jgi:hypothetical protein
MLILNRDTDTCTCEFQMNDQIFRYSIPFLVIIKYFSNCTIVSIYSMHFLLNNNESSLIHYKEKSRIHSVKYHKKKTYMFRQIMPSSSQFFVILNLVNHRLFNITMYHVELTLKSCELMIYIDEFSIESKSAPSHPPICCLFHGKCFK